MNCSRTTRMFGAFKRFFKKSPENRLNPSAQVQNLPDRSPVETAHSTRRKIVPFSSAHDSTSGGLEMVTVSFHAILNNLPLELHGKSSPPSSAKFCIPKDEVIKQLANGAVKVNFGDLRRAAPVGIFKTGSDLDSRAVDLPLCDILSQLPANTYARRPQQRVEISNDITDLFGRKGEPLAKVRILQKNEISQGTTHTRKTASAPASAGVHPQPSAQPAPTALPKPAPVPGLRTQAPANAPISMGWTPPKAHAPVSPRTPLTPHWPKPAAPASAPLPGPGLVASPKPGLSQHTPPISAAPAPVESAPVEPLPASIPAPTTATPSCLPEFLTLSLADLCKYWPEAINREIAQSDLLSAECQLPLSQIGRAVKNGMVQLPWRVVRSWVRPTPAKAESANGDVMVEIPLKLVASLTLAQGFPAPPKKKDKSGHAQPPAPSPAPARAARPGPRDEKSILSVALADLSKDWPEALRNEISIPELAEAQVELSRDDVQAGLKLGKVQFSWNEIQSWLKPSPPAPLGAAFAETLLPLPLPFLVPLLFPSATSSAPKRTTAADEIPDLFNMAGSKQAATPAPEEQAAPAPEEVEEQAPAAPAPVQTKPARDPKNLAELFGDPDKRNWTPNEIVHQTTLLPGVKGSLIALQDGLLVASCMPPSWKTETIAAFLPQIFGRMNQYAKELKMGDLSSVNFAVEQGTLQIFNAGIIYFAALGEANTPLPTSLNLIAHELSRHTR